MQLLAGQLDGCNAVLDIIKAGRPKSPVNNGGIRALVSCCSYSANHKKAILSRTLLQSLSLSWPLSVCYTLTALSASGSWMPWLSNQDRSSRQSSALLAAAVRLTKSRYRHTSVIDHLQTCRRGQLQMQECKADRGQGCCIAVTLACIQTQICRHRNSAC